VNDELFAQAEEVLGGPGRRFFVPGRIEVLGKHTDYAGGRSIVGAVERGLHLVVAPSEDETVRMTDMRANDTIDFPLKSEPAPVPAHWSTYPRTVAAALVGQLEGGLRGVTVVFGSDLPPAAGLGSSSVLVVATFLALAAANPWLEDALAIDTPEELASYLAAVETGIGTEGGSEDHIAILCSAPGELRQYAYRPVRLEQVLRMPFGHVFAIAVSGVRAEKSCSARERYNQAARLAADLAELWREVTGRADSHLGAALASSGEARDQLRKALRSSSQELRDRFEHFLAESEEIVPRAGEALATADLSTFGEQVDRSQALAEGLLGNQVPETVSLARSARQLGAVAASVFGAGFGGSVWALVTEQEGPRFLGEWRASHLEAFPQRREGCSFFVTDPGPAAQEL
jgi:galactokinase